MRFIGSRDSLTGGGSSNVGYGWMTRKGEGAKCPGTQRIGPEEVELGIAPLDKNRGPHKGGRTGTRKGRERKLSSLFGIALSVFAGRLIRVCTKKGRRK